MSYNIFNVLFNLNIKQFYHISQAFLDVVGQSSGILHHKIETCKANCQVKSGITGLVILGITFIPGITKPVITGFVIHGIHCMYCSCYGTH